MLTKQLESAPSFHPSGPSPTWMLLPASVAWGYQKAMPGPPCSESRCSVASGLSLVISKSFYLRFLAPKPIWNIYVCLESLESHLESNVGFFPQIKDSMLTQTGIAKFYSSTALLSSKLVFYSYHPFLFISSSINQIEDTTTNGNINLGKYKK